MFESFKILFLMFITYAFIGWCMECIYMYLDCKTLTNRGFFIGPYCPIYGFGAVFMSMLLQKYVGDTIALFLFAMVVCSILEYLTSFILEKIFHARWWDYSHELFNINGRICLKTMIPFGVLGVIVLEYLNPFILGIYNSFSSLAFNIIFYTIAVIFFSDVIVSLYILIKLRIHGNVASKEEDNTIEMSNKVMEALKTLSWPYKRLINAFPNINYLGSRIKKKILKKEKSKRKK